MANDIAESAEAILAALNGNTAFPEHLSRRFSLDESYAVQFELLRRRQARGDVHVGWKVGLTPGPCSFSREFTSPAWVTWLKPGTSPRRPCSASTS